MPIAKSVEDTVLGEAKAGDFADMLGIVSVIDNRSAQLGVSYQDVVSAQGQFDAYGKAMPPGVSKYRDMAKQALAQVQERGPVHTATFYATPAAAKGLPEGLSFETKTAGHNYYSDPQGRAIATAEGYRTPDPAASRAPTNVAGDPSGTLYDVVDESVAASPAVASTTPAAQAIDTAMGKTGLAPSGQGLLSGYSNYTDPVAYGRSATRSAQPFSGAVAHHAEPRSLDALRSVTNNPRSDGSYLGYHFGVDPAGNVAQLAPLDARTNHIGRVSSNIGGLTNANSLGIAFTDAYGPVTQESIEAAAETIAAVNRAGSYGFIDPDNIGYHGKGATDTREVEGQLEAEGIRSYLGGLPFGPNHTPTPTPNPMNQTSMPGRSLVDPTAAFQSVTSAPLAPVDAPRSPMPGRSLVTPTAPPTVEDQVTAMTPAIGMPTVGPNFGPAAPSFSVPSVAPVPTARPTMTAPPMARPAPVRSMPSVAAPVTAPAPSVATASDVWGGKAANGLATNGNVLSRNPDGNISMMSSKYGYVDTMSPTGEYRGTTAPGLLGIDAAARSMFGGLGKGPGIAGPVAGQGIQTPTQSRQSPVGRQSTASRQSAPSQSNIGTGLRSAAGAVAGGMVGGLLGPVGGLLGSYVGAQMARGKNPFSGLLGRSANPSPAQAQASFAQGYTPGLGFPTAPDGPNSQGGLTSYGIAASRGGFGGQAQAAANNPGTGLF